MKTKIKTYLNNLNLHRLKPLKPIFYKSVFSLVVILCFLGFKALNFKSTRWILDKVKHNINYEIEVKETGKKALYIVKGLVKDSKEVLTVFNLDSKEKYASPISGEIYKPFEAEINKGVDIRSIDEKDPKSIIKGTVKDIYLQEKQGYFVTIEREDLAIVYGYLSEVYVSKGDSVNVETPIGSLGTNKDGSKYLRIEIKEDGVYKDPSDYIDLK